MDADTSDVLLLVGIMLSVMGFFAEFIPSNLNRHLRERMEEIDNRCQRVSESARAERWHACADPLHGHDRFMG